MGESLPHGWRLARLNELGSVERGRSRHRPRNAPHLYGGRYPFVQTGDIKAAGLRLFDFTQTYSDAGLAQSRLWPVGTLCITIAANICDTTILGIPACFPDSVVGFTPAQGATHVVYVKYALDLAKRRFTDISRGATQDNLSVEKMLSQLLPVPPLPIQRRIASILGAYDDLIEVNRRRIAVLEEMVRRLFDEWFVHFRFPGHEGHRMVETEHGRLPEGWCVGMAADILAFDPPTKVPRAGSKPFIPMTALSTSNSLIEDTQYREGNSGSKFQNGDTLFARITPCLENGKTGLVRRLSSDGGIGFGSTEFIVMRKRVVGPSFVYCLARSEPFRAHAIKSMSGATGRQRVRVQSLQQFTVAVPPAELIEYFENVTWPMLEMVGAIGRSTLSLAHSRDLLLPRLISGELSVIEAERELDAAA